MFGYRSKKYYKELKKIPNVKLIRPTEVSFTIIAAAKIVFTTTGTVGWEGLLLKKPVITFGNAFYNHLPMVKKCDRMTDLPALVKEQLENFTYDEVSLINLLTAIFKESANLDLVQIWDVEGGGNMEKKKEMVVSFVDFLATKINLKPILNK